MRLEELTFEEAGAYLDRDDRLILPFGSVEQNGPHLPLGTDRIVSQAIAELVAHRTGVLVAPGIPWGNADADLAFPATVSLSPRVLNDLLDELCSGFARHGFRRIVVLAGHLSNVWNVASVAGTLRRRGVLLAQVDVWRLAAKLGGNLLSSKTTFGHADELCTSIVMALSPHLVRTDRLESFAPSPGWEWDTYASYPEVMGFSAWEDVSPLGTVGDPTLASRDTGRRLVELLVDRVCELIDDMAKVDLPGGAGPG